MITRYCRGWVASLLNEIGIAFAEVTCLETFEPELWVALAGPAANVVPSSIADDSSAF
jgi:hypothetical protein